MDSQCAPVVYCILSMRQRIKSILSLFHALPAPAFLVSSSISFYVLLIILNPSNKITAAFVTGFTLLIFFKLKNIRTTLICSNLISSIILTGKRYDLVIIPPGLFSVDFYPLGYFVSLIISASSIVSFFIGVILFRDWITGKFKGVSLIFPDYMIIIGMFLKLFSNFYVSPMPNIGMLLWLFSLPSVIAYFSIRLYNKTEKTLIPYCLTIFGTLVFIESALGILHFLHGSSFGTSLEIQTDIEQFGTVADEYNYRYRPTGTFEHANMLGAYLAVYLPVVLFLSYIRRTAYRTIILVSALFALGLTISRSAWLAVIAVSIISRGTIRAISASLIQKVHALTLTALCLAVLIFSYFIVIPRLYSSLFSATDDGGLSLRYAQSVIALRLIGQSPFFGTGTAMSVPSGLQYDQSRIIENFPSPVHNYYILLATENGIPSLIVFLLFMYSTSYILYKKRKRTPEVHQHIWYTYISAVSAVIVISFFQPYNFQMHLGFLFALLYAYEPSFLKTT